MGSSSSKPGAGGGRPDALGEELLQAHNRYRRAHGSPPLEWNEEAAQSARRWASRLARLGRLEHDSNSGMGQNLFSKSAFGSAVKVTGAEVAASWYNEVKQYDYSQPGFSPATGHFTQMVWSSTTRMGTGSAVQGNSVYVVANYSPPGNIIGRQNFTDNVRRPK